MLRSDVHWSHSHPECWVLRAALLPKKHPSSSSPPREGEERRRGTNLQNRHLSEEGEWVIAPLEDFSPGVTVTSARLSRLEAAQRAKRVPFPANPLAPLHTCTAISRLINCESCSLETLNHSFSVLSRAASLTALTRVPPCLPNTRDGGGRRWGEWGFRRPGEVPCRGASNLDYGRSMSASDLKPREGIYPWVSL